MRLLLLVGLLLLHSRTATATHSRCPRAGQSTHHARSELFWQGRAALISASPPPLKHGTTAVSVYYQIGGGGVRFTAGVIAAGT